MDVALPGACSRPLCNQPKFLSPLGAGRGRHLTAPPPGQKCARSGGAIRRVFSDNSVVGHTRITES